MHSPPLGRLDAIPVPLLTGCAVQAEMIAHAMPSLCVFGHYHSSYEAEKLTWKDDSDAIDRFEVLESTRLSFQQDELRRGEHTLFVNAAWMTMQKGEIPRRNQPRVVEMVLG